MNIPKIFHHIWFGPKEYIPAANLTFRDHAKTLHPGWEFMLWTEENIPQIINRDAFDFYLPTRVFASDILRYEILASFGGVYMDWDVFLHKPIDDLIQGTDHFFAEENHNFVTNCIYGASPNHWLSWKLIRECKRSHIINSNSGLFANKKQEGLSSVGVKFFNNAIQSTDQSVSLNILPYKIFNPYKPSDFRSGMWNPKIPDYSYGMHTFSSTVDQRNFEFYMDLAEFDEHRLIDAAQKGVIHDS